MLSLPRFEPGLLGSLTNSAMPTLFPMPVHFWPPKALFTLITCSDSENTVHMVHSRARIKFFELLNFVPSLDNYFSYGWEECQLWL